MKNFQNENGPRVEKVWEPLVYTSKSSSGGAIFKILNLYLIVAWFIRMNQALCICLSTPMQSTFLGSVCKSFLRLGHHNV